MPKNKWLYNQKIVAWLYKKPNFRNQLPFLYRFFGYYCKINKKLSKKEEVIGGEFIFSSLINITKLLKLKNYARLDLDHKTVFLNLLDPRMLNIPNEVRSKQTKTLLSSFIAEGDTFLDVGANHGSFSLIASELVGASGKILAIEPQAQLAKLVEKSLEVNAQCEYQVYAIACGDRDGTIDFYIPLWSSGSAGIFPSFSAKYKHKKVSVPLKKFDRAVDWQNFPGRTFIKLDVEGSELAFLRGARQMLSILQPNILIEINPWSLKAAKIEIGEMIQVLQEIGYVEFLETTNLTQKKKLDEMDGNSYSNAIIISPKSMPVSI